MPVSVGDLDDGRTTPNPGAVGMTLCGHAYGKKCREASIWTSTFLLTTSLPSISELQNSEGSLHAGKDALRLQTNKAPRSA